VRELGVVRGRGELVRRRVAAVVGHGRHGHVVVVGDNVHALHLVLLLPLHPPVLEPDFDLALRQTQSVCNFNTPTTGKISIEVELFFELQRLVSRVRRPLPFCFTVRVHSTCGQTETPHQKHVHR